MSRTASPHLSPPPAPTLHPPPSLASSTPSAPSVPSLPPPFCPASSPLPELAALRYRFMRRHAPVFLQPSVDVANGNGLLALFYHFSDDNSTCVLSLVYESEASYEVARPQRINSLGTFLYRSHNYRTYHRTAVHPHYTTPPHHISPDTAQPITSLSASPSSVCAGRTSSTWRMRAVD